MKPEADKSDPPVLRRAYSVSHFTLLFDIGRTQTFSEIRHGRLSARKVGARTLIAHDDAMAWLNSLPLRTR